MKNKSDFKNVSSKFQTLSMLPHNSFEDLPDSVYKVLIVVNCCNVIIMCFKLDIWIDFPTNAANHINKCWENWFQTLVNTSLWNIPQHVSNTQNEHTFIIFGLFSLPDCSKLFNTVKHCIKSRGFAAKINIKDYTQH